MNNYEIAHLMLETIIAISRDAFIRLKTCLHYI